MFFFTHMRNVLYEGALCYITPLSKIMRLIQRLNVSHFDKKNLEARLDLDLLPAAEQIEKNFKDILLPPPAGIYRFDRLEPVMEPTKQYFTKNERGLQPILDINQVTTTVYDANERIIIPAGMIKSKATSLSDTSFFPYRGVMIAAAVVEHTIDSYIQWRRTKSDFFGKMARHFQTDELTIDDFRELIDNMSVDLSQALYDWFGGQPWHVFLANRKNTRMQVERYGDYRIMDWMDRFESGEIKL